MKRKNIATNFKVTAYTNSLRFDIRSQVFIERKTAVLASTPRCSSDAPENGDYSLHVEFIVAFNSMTLIQRMRRYNCHQMFRAFFIYIFLRESVLQISRHAEYNRYIDGNRYLAVVPTDYTAPHLKLARTLTAAILPFPNLTPGTQPSATTVPILKRKSSATTVPILKHKSSATTVPILKHKSSPYKQTEGHYNASLLCLSSWLISMGVHILYDS
jgi:hypothetical protein